MSEDKPTIDVPKDGPFLVKGLKKLTDADNQQVAMEKEVIALCRCGASENKPFCDGTHKDVGFSGEREGTENYPVREYKGQELTVVDDIGICCHAGSASTAPRRRSFAGMATSAYPNPTRRPATKSSRPFAPAPRDLWPTSWTANCTTNLLLRSGDLHLEGWSLHVRGGIAFNDPDGRASDDRSLHPVSLWGIEEQTVLRRLTHGRRFQGLIFSLFHSNRWPPRRQRRGGLSMYSTRRRAIPSADPKLHSCRTRNSIRHWVSWLEGHRGLWLGRIRRALGVALVGVSLVATQRTPFSSPSEWMRVSS